MLQFSFMHATKQVMYATGLHRSLSRVSMLLNRVAYATGLHRIRICMSLSSRVHMLQNRVMYATGLHRIRICMSLSSRVDIYATEQGCVRHGTPQNRDMCVTEQQGLYVICYRTGLRTLRGSTEQGYVCH